MAVQIVESEIWLSRSTSGSPKTVTVASPFLSAPSVFDKNATSSGAARQLGTWCQSLKPCCHEAASPVSWKRCVLVECKGGSTGKLGSEQCEFGCVFRVIEKSVGRHGFAAESCGVAPFEWWTSSVWRHLPCDG